MAQYVCWLLGSEIDVTKSEQPSAGEGLFAHVKKCRNSSRIWEQIVRAKMTNDIIEENNEEIQRN